MRGTKSLAMAQTRASGGSVGVTFMVTRRGWERGFPQVSP
jgi:hypothetical protein